MEYERSHPGNHADRSEFPGSEVAGRSVNINRGASRIPARNPCASNPTTIPSRRRQFRLSPCPRCRSDRSPPQRRAERSPFWLLKTRRPPTRARTVSPYRSVAFTDWAVAPASSRAISPGCGVSTGGVLQSVRSEGRPAMALSASASRTTVDPGVSEAIGPARPSQDAWTAPDRSPLQFSPV